jgi:hypothetical protein
MLHRYFYCGIRYFGVKDFLLILTDLMKPQRELQVNIFIGAENSQPPVIILVIILSFFFRSFLKLLISVAL